MMGNAPIRARSGGPPILRELFEGVEIGFAGVSLRTHT
jgi:hypothetical protein